MIPSNRYIAFRRDACSGAALFMAISILALFSVLGASYIRFMSLELEESDMRIRQIRARHYAVAGVQSAGAHIVRSLQEGETPASDQNYAFGLYAQQQGTSADTLSAMTDYAAEARVTVIGLDEEVWRDRFGNGPSWPGVDRAFTVTSVSTITRAGAGRMYPVARYGVEAVLVAQADVCEVLAWHTLADDASAK